MGITKVIIAIAVTAMTITASADPKCNHQNGSGMFASTNPVSVKVAKASTATQTTGSAKSGVR